MRRIILLILVLYTAHTSGQQRPGISQYMFNGLLINPAYAGIYHEVNASLMHRQQWINIDGAPQTTLFTFHTDFQNTKSGAGLMSYVDQAGVHRDIGLFASYSYKIEFPGKRKLSMGLQLGFNQLRSDFSQLTVRDLQDPFYGVVHQSFKPNVGVGVFYYSENFYVGASVPYILTPPLINSGDVVSVGTLPRNYFVTAGKVISFGQRLKLKPSVLVRFKEGQAFGLDLNGNLYIDNVIAFGASLRSEGTIIGLFEVKLNENLRFGYAFDYTAGRLDRFTDGTHELMINYRFMWPNAKRNDQLCPTYF